MDFARARQMMVDGQIRTTGVTDRRVIAAAADVPRELFLPATMQGLAYLDHMLPLDWMGAPARGRALIPPMTLARLLQAAEIQPGDRVLDVACGTGYGAALLSRLAGHVLALDDNDACCSAARDNLARGGYPVAVVKGALAEGCPDQGLYDVILVEGGIEDLPSDLGRQLREGGRLVCIAFDRGVGRGMRYLREASGLSARPVFDAPAPLLRAFARPKTFVF